LLNARTRARERRTEGCCGTKKEREREKERATRAAARRFSAKFAFSAVRKFVFFARNVQRVNFFTPDDRFRSASESARPRL